MLAPDSRTLLLDALRPPPGHILDRAVATTFTLDLAAALMALLAFAGFRFDEKQDPIEVMEALRTESGLIDVFCQAGCISAGGWPTDLLALLENVVHEVRRPRPGHVFHPKVWVLRFLDPSRDPFFRLLVLSRNLTSDRSWDTILWLDGRLAGRPADGHAPLARFVAALPGLAVEPLPNDRRERIEGLARELERVEWDLPDGVREARFHPIGIPGAPPFAAEEHFGGYRRLAISPFVREGALRRILQPRAGERAVLISRGEELGALPPGCLDGLEVYELDPAAGLTEDDLDGERDQAFLTRLHAKVFAVERARLAHLFIGSSNATDAGLGGNIEFLCELVGRVATLGVDALIGDDAPFRAMLAPHAPGEEPKVDQANTAHRALDDLLIDIAAEVRFQTAVIRRDDGWAPHITADAAPPRFPECAAVTIAPYNRPSETRPLDPLRPADLELPSRELADVTPFLQLTASRTVDGAVVESSAVICSRLVGAPDDRFEEILTRQIDTPEKFLRLLSLLIGLGSGRGGDAAQTGVGTASWSSAGSGQGVLELLAQALAERPESIDHLASIVERLRRSAGGRTVLPPGWDDVWLPLLKAREAMLEEAV